MGGEPPVAVIRIVHKRKPPSSAIGCVFVGVRSSPGKPERLGEDLPVGGLHVMHRIDGIPSAFSVRYELIEVAGNLERLNAGDWQDGRVE